MHSLRDTAYYKRDTRFPYSQAEMCGVYHVCACSTSIAPPKTRDTVIHPSKTRMALGDVCITVAYYSRDTRDASRAPP